MSAGPPAATRRPRLARLRRLLRPPRREPQETRYLLRVLRTVLLSSVVASVLLLANALVVGQDWVAWILAGSIGVVLLMVMRLRRGDLHTPSLILPAAMLVGVTLVLVLGRSGIHDLAILVYPLVIITAGLLLARSAALLFSSLSIASALLVVVAEAVGLLGKSYSLRSSLYDGLTLAVLLSFTGVMLWLIMTTLRSSLARARNDERALATSNRQLRERERELGLLIDDLEARNAEMSRFNYTVSHDLKAPLVTIAGFTDLIERDLAAGRGDALRDDLERIRKAVATMSALLDGLLRVSRKGAPAIELEPLDFGEIAGEALELLDLAVRERHVEVVLHDDLPRVLGQRPHLIEVVQNLVENSVKFMGDQPRPRVEIGTEVRNGERLLFVRDNGVGIDPAFHRRIFTLFHRLDPSIEGTGVGLALVERIIEAHGGRVWVESAGHGAGATFFFTLPPAHRRRGPAPGLRLQVPS